MSSSPLSPEVQRNQHSEPAWYGHEPRLLLPESFYRPFWKSLAINLRDKMLPERLPPLLLTSRPIDLGMLVGDIVALPWYRTVFTNLGDVISPEVLPPLQLESRPAEVGELISDQISHLWFTSLLRNLADAVAPEKLPPLQLTSNPVDPGLPDDLLELPRWSALIPAPKYTASEQPKPAYLPPPQPRVPVPAPKPVDPETHPDQVHAKRLKERLSFSRLREAVLITIAAAEAIYLLASYLGFA